MAGKYDKVDELYYENIEPKLDAISEYKSYNLSNKDIAKHMQVPYVKFQEFVKKFKPLQDALTVGEDMIVDQAESALYQQAFKRGNVTAIKYILEHLAPNKWGSKADDVPRQMPEINIKFEDAKMDRDELDKIVDDIAKVKEQNESIVS